MSEKSHPPNLELFDETEAYRLETELLSKFFRALGDGTRLKIIQLLAEKNMNVTELVNALDVQQGRVSSHLACLRWCGFISSYKEGKYAYYTITDKRVLQLLSLGKNMLKDNAEKVNCCTRIGGIDS